MGLLASPFHGKPNLTSTNWPPPGGPFLSLPLSCQGLNFTSMGHSGPRWIPLVGFGWFMVGLHSDLCNFYFYYLFFSHTIPSSWIHRVVYRYIMVTEYYPCLASTIWPVNLVLSTIESIASTSINLPHDRSESSAVPPYIRPVVKSLVANLPTIWRVLYSNQILYNKFFHR